MTASGRLPGHHLLLDFEGARNLEGAAVDAALRAAATAAGATALQLMLHPFPGGGMTGVLLLAESHISVHTWPERGFVALDVFLCGGADIAAARAALEAAFQPTTVTATLVTRGQA